MACISSGDGAGIDSLLCSDHPHWEWERDSLLVQLPPHGSARCGLHTVGQAGLLRRLHTSRCVCPSIQLRCRGRALRLGTLPPSQQDPGTAFRGTEFWKGRSDRADGLDEARLDGINPSYPIPHGSVRIKEFSSCHARASGSGRVGVRVALVQNRRCFTSAFIHTRPRAARPRGRQNRLSRPDGPGTTSCRWRTTAAPTARRHRRAGPLDHHRLHGRRLEPTSSTGNNKFHAGIAGMKT